MLRVNFVEELLDLFLALYPVSEVVKTTSVLSEHPFRCDSFALVQVLIRYKCCETLTEIGTWESTKCMSSLLTSPSQSKSYLHVFRSK